MDTEFTKKIKDFADDLTNENFKSEEEIKFKMEELDLVYTKDEIERLNRVLLALHPISKKIQQEQDHKEISH